MKKILSLIMMIYVINCNGQIKGSNTISDTSKYLKDSVIAKSNFYVGKPLSVLLKDLKIKIRSYSGIIPFDYLPDTISFKETTFDFCSISDLASHTKMKIKSPNIHVVFSKPIFIPKYYFKIDNLLSGDWDSRKAAFFGNCIIASLEVRGLSPNKPPLLQNLLDTTDHH